MSSITITPSFDVDTSDFEKHVFVWSSCRTIQENIPIDSGKPIVLSLPETEEPCAVFYHVYCRKREIRERTTVSASNSHEAVCISAGWGGFMLPHDRSFKNVVKVGVSEKLSIEHQCLGVPKKPVNDHLQFAVDRINQTFENEDMRMVYIDPFFEHHKYMLLSNENFYVTGSGSWFGTLSISVMADVHSFFPVTQGSVSRERMSIIRNKTKEILHTMYEKNSTLGALEHNLVQLATCLLLSCSGVRYPYTHDYSCTMNNIVDLWMPSSVLQFGDCEDHVLDAMRMHAYASLFELPDWPELSAIARRFEFWGVVGTATQAVYEDYELLDRALLTSMEELFEKGDHDALDIKMTEEEGEICHCWGWLRDKVTGEGVFVETTIDEMKSLPFGVVHKNTKYAKGDTRYYKALLVFNGSGVYSAVRHNERLSEKETCGVYVRDLLQPERHVFDARRKPNKRVSVLRKMKIDEKFDNDFIRDMLRMCTPMWVVDV